MVSLKGSRAVFPAQSLQGGAHHLHGPGGVHIDNVHLQGRQHTHRLFHGVGNVVELEIQEHAVSAPLELAHHFGSLGIEELHPNLDKGRGLSPERLYHSDNIL